MISFCKLPRITLAEGDGSGRLLHCLAKEVVCCVVVVHFTNNFNAQLHEKQCQVFVPIVVRTFSEFRVYLCL